MIYKILVPSGIGDFSWLWSKISTTKDVFDIEYADSGPDRLGAFLALLPKDKIISYRKSTIYRFYFDTRELEGFFGPADGPKVQHYSEMNPYGLNFLEPNTHLERGGRIENWLPDIASADLHYEINGLDPHPKTEDIFLVHLSSSAVKNAWRCYDWPIQVEIIKALSDASGLRPVFIGAKYDDYAQLCFKEYSQTSSKRGVNMIGETEDLLSALHLIQHCRFFLGSISSGLSILANVLNKPVAAWWPRPGLPASWPDHSIPYLWMLWKDPAEDLDRIETWLKEAVL